MADDDPARVRVRLGQHIQDLGWGRLVTSGVDQYRGAGLPLSACPGAQHLALIVGQRPCAPQLADDSRLDARVADAVGDLPLEEYFRSAGVTIVQAAFAHSYFIHSASVKAKTPYFSDRASGSTFLY